MYYSIIFVLASILIIPFFSGCSVKPLAVREGKIKRYELGGKEPCLDLIIRRNKLAKKLVNVEIKEQNIMMEVYTFLSIEKTYSPLKQCRTDSGSLTNKGNQICTEYLKSREAVDGCISIDSSILVNPYVHLRGELKDDK